MQLLRVFAARTCQNYNLHIFWVSPSRMYCSMDLSDDHRPSFFIIGLGISLRSRLLTNLALNEWGVIAFTRTSITSLFRSAEPEKMIGSIDSFFESYSWRLFTSSRFKHVLPFTRLSNHNFPFEYYRRSGFNVVPVIHHRLELRYRWKLNGILPRQLLYLPPVCIDQERFVPLWSSYDASPICIFCINRNRMHSVCITALITN